MTGSDRRRLLLGYLAVAVAGVALYALFRSPQISAALFILGAPSLVGLLKPPRVVAHHLRAVVLPLPPRADNA